MIKKNWDVVEEASEYKRLGTGGYVCIITKATDVPEKEYLKLEYDIVDGEFKDYYKDLMASKNFWGGSFIRSYKETAERFFKGFLTSVESSNSGFKFDSDESKLVGKKVGLVLAEEEYKKQDGTIAIRLYVSNVSKVETIKKGEFIVPELKRLAGFKEAAATFSQTGFAVSGDELPF